MLKFSLLLPGAQILSVLPHAQRLMNSAYSVSYTHLDVYKRQDTDIIRGLATLRTRFGEGQEDACSQSFQTRLPNVYRLFYRYPGQFGHLLYYIAKV